MWVVMYRFLLKIAKRLNIEKMGSHGGALSQNEIFLLGQIASRQNLGIHSVNQLHQVGFKVSSQWEEDGIIDWLINVLDIPDCRFVEFGVESYKEANTRFLLQNRNWRGLIIDGSMQNIDSVKMENIYWRHDLTAVSEFITAENINDLLVSNGMDGDIGLLSIDIDGNDYWVWKAINVTNPILVIVEYNAVFGDCHPLTIPYDPLFDRTRAHSSNLYFGASIAALNSLASKKGDIVL